MEKEDVVRIYKAEIEEVKVTLAQLGLRKRAAKRLNDQKWLDEISEGEKRCAEILDEYETALSEIK